MLILISEFRLSIRRSLISEIIKLDEKRRRCGGVGRLNTPLSLPRDLFTQRENSSIRLDQRVLREEEKTSHSSIFIRNRFVSERDEKSSPLFMTESSRKPLRQETRRQKAVFVCVGEEIIKQFFPLDQAPGTSKVVFTLELEDLPLPAARRCARFPQTHKRVTFGVRLGAS